jgi:DNA polymerase III epsilon subunit-like protein
MKSENVETYISVDIEASGPIPGEYSMLSIGACVVKDRAKTFYVELQPINDNYIPEALAVSKFDLERLKTTGQPAAVAIAQFATWIKQVASEGSPVFVGFNACFDWAFVNWYFHKYTNGNPFGIGGIDIKAFYMGLSGSPWSQTRSSQLPNEFKGTSPHTHNALDDARAQGEIFHKLLLASVKRSESVPGDQKGLP